MAVKIQKMDSPKSAKPSVSKASSSPGDLTYVQKVIGQDTWLVMSQSQVQLEDEFASLYYTVQNQSNIFLMPPFDPQVLLNLVQANNVLNQCIEAMEVNIDATGHEFVPSDVAESQVQALEGAWKQKQSKQKLSEAKNQTDYHNAVALAKHKLLTTPPAPPDDLPSETGGTKQPGTPGSTGSPPNNADQPTQQLPVLPEDWPEPMQYEPKEPMPEFGNGIDPDELLRAKEFFNEPYPNTSLSQIRRKLRRELESVGYAYLEVLRNLGGDIVGVRNIETHQTRMVKLDAPILVEKTISRGGKDVKIQMWERQRRFAQRVALKQLVYYREFGTARHVDRNTGKWEIQPTATDPGYEVAIENRGTELIVFGIHPDITTPYFVPRWINQMPSVVGSRKAEELNLEFLDSGGMPPAIIFIQGGTLAKDAADQLRMYLSGKNKNKHRAVVVEAQSSSGSIEAAGSVQVKVERFGSERMNDAMFTKYDAATEEHVRVGFRLPPLFLGKAADYNLATAQTAYMVAEEQVFQPERTAFDEKINRTIMKELGFKTLRFKSLPVTLTDANAQNTALTQAKGTVTNESFVKAINVVTGFDLDAEQQQASAVGGPAAGMPPPNHAGGFPPGGGGGGGGGASGVSGSIGGASDAAGALNSNTGGVGKYARETPSATELIALAQDYLSMNGLAKKQDLSVARKAQVTTKVASLSKTEKRAFDSLVATFTYGSADPDLVNIARHTHRH